MSTALRSLVEKLHDAVAGSQQNEARYGRAGRWSTAKSWNKPGRYDPGGRREIGNEWDEPNEKHYDKTDRRAEETAKKNALFRDQAMPELLAAAIEALNGRVAADDPAKKKKLESYIELLRQRQSQWVSKIAAPYASVPRSEVTPVVEAFKALLGNHAKFYFHGVFNIHDAVTFTYKGYKQGHVTGVVRSLWKSGPDVVAAPAALATPTPTPKAPAKQARGASVSSQEQLDVLQKALGKRTDPHLAAALVSIQQDDAWVATADEDVLKKIRHALYTRGMRKEADLFRTR